MPGRAAADLVPKAFFGADNHGISDDTASDDDDDDDGGACSSEGERRDKFNADAVPAPSHGGAHGNSGGPRSARRSRRDDSDDTDFSERDSMDVVLRKVSRPPCI
jgi:hypothetical protein